ncbi:MAG TPA: hypothetical protein DCE44_12070 [Verrucomicrobiales bacterium]|nr:hypothetical protein [Verrucomicrobiales bacterium]
MVRLGLESSDANHDPDLGRAAALRRPRAEGTVFRSDAVEEFDTSLRKPAQSYARAGEGAARLPCRLNG